MPGILYLVPVTLGDDQIGKALPSDAIRIIQRLEHFVVENEKTARRFLGVIKPLWPIREISMVALNEHTDAKALKAMLQPLLENHDVGLMSEAGCPGIADPGADLVALAHRHQIKVVPLVGPSSILLSLMASGLNGQQFAFTGYLPSEKTARINKIKDLEQRSRQAGETQIFIETPYRNQHVLQDLLDHCHPATRVCVSTNVSLGNESISTKTVQQWKSSTLPDLHKQLTVFLLLAN